MQLRASSSSRCCMQRPQQRLAAAGAAARRPPPGATGAAPRRGCGASSSRRGPPPPASYPPPSASTSGTPPPPYITSIDDPEVADIIHLAKHRLARRQQQQQATPQGPLGDFFHKLQLAWRVFFPENPKALSPKEEGKQRLRMILVADRVGMNEVTMEAMRERIIGAVSPYVEIESPELVEVAVTTDADLGAIYSVAVPVKRVKPAARVALNEEGEFEGAWDPHNEEGDPASHFPYGT